jgi:dipeptidyl aminopeptidase/acylaminoacyl peptidase
MSSSYTLIQFLASGLLTLGIIAGSMDCQHQNHPKSIAPSIVSSGIPPIPDSLRQKVSQYQNWRSATLVDWNPDGRSLLVLRRANETSQLFAVNTAGRAPVQMTNLNETVLSAFVCPDPKRKTVLFTQDSGGNENFQIYSLSFDSRKIMRLTHDAGQNDGIVWSNRGDLFAYSSNRRNGKDFDLYIHGINRSTNDSLILSKGGMWSAHDWSPDDRRLLVSCYVSRTASRLFVLDIKTRSVQPLTDSADTMSEELGAWSAASKGIFFTSDSKTDFRCLRYFDCSTRCERLLTASIPWDVREFSLSRNRDLIAFATNEHGFSRLYIMDTATFACQPIPGLPKGIISNLRFHPYGGFLGMTVTTPNQPDDVYALDIRESSLIRWTKSDSGIQPIVEPVIMHYPSFDTINGKPRLIPCIAYKPTGKKPPYPVLITIHGGPESQFWPSFKPDLLFQINELGIAVLAPNIRGSGGYGKTWLTLDNGFKREDAVRDFGALLDWVAQQPDLDTTRVAVMGGSYGGYVTLASLVKYNDRLAAGVDLYGISNFVAFLEHTAPYRRDARRAEYGDESDPAMRKFLLEISPLTHADHITKPLLIIQGANDARVPIAESRQIADAIRKNGGEAWFLVANDEGHGYRKKSNREYQDAVMAQFLTQFLVR